MTWNILGTSPYGSGSGTAFKIVKNANITKNDKITINSGSYKGSHTVKDVVFNTSYTLVWVNVRYKGGESKATLSKVGGTGELTKSVPEQLVRPDHVLAGVNDGKFTKVYSHGTGIRLLSRYLKLEPGDKVQITSSTGKYNGIYPVDLTSSTYPVILSLYYNGTDEGYIRKVASNSPLTAVSGIEFPKASSGRITHVYSHSSSDAAKNKSVILKVTPGINVKAGDKVNITTKLYTGTFPVGFAAVDGKTIYLFSLPYKGMSSGTITKASGTAPLTTVSKAQPVTKVSVKSASKINSPIPAYSGKVMIKVGYGLDLKKGDKVKLDTDLYSGVFAIDAVNKEGTNLTFYSLPYESYKISGTVEKVSNTTPITTLSRPYIHMKKPVEESTTVKTIQKSASTQPLVKSSLPVQKSTTVLTATKSTIPDKETATIKTPSIAPGGSFVNQISSAIKPNEVKILKAEKIHTVATSPKNGKTSFQIPKDSLDIKKGDKIKINSTLYSGVFLVDMVAQHPVCTILHCYTVPYKGDTTGTISIVSASTPSTDKKPELPANTSLVVGVGQLSSGLPAVNGKCSFHIEGITTYSKGDRVKITTSLYNGVAAVSFVKGAGTSAVSLHFYDVPYKGSSTGKIEKVAATTPLTFLPEPEKPPVVKPELPKSTETKGYIKSMVEISSSNASQNGKLAIYLTPGMKLKKGDSVKFDTPLYSGTHKIDSVSTDSTLLKFFSVKWIGDSTGTIEKVTPVVVTPPVVTKPPVVNKPPSTGTGGIGPVQPGTGTVEPNKPPVTTEDPELKKFKADFMNYINNNTKVKQIRKVVADYPTKSAATAANLNIPVWQACFTIETIITEILKIIK